jgi:serine/threonine protein kinase
MGEVYRARDTRLDRAVAVKILPPDLSSSVELKARFEREARAVSTLSHPHICHLYDIGSQDGTAYLVMEYLEGESLADRLHKGALPLKQTLHIGVQIAEALAAAHRAGILHRDLKPANVMLTVGGAKLLDFGLAKTSPTVASTAGAGVSGMTPSTPTMTIAELSSPAKALTQKGTVVGTFQYMAPEVLQGVEADARSDIFSLGCVLYEMATGKRAFEGKSQLSVLTGILEKDPDPVSRVQPTSPPALDHVVKTCLEKNPDERFQTAHDVKVQLKWIAEGGAQAELAAPTRQSSRLGWLAAGVLFVALGASIAAYLNVASHPSLVVRSTILPPPGTSFVAMTPDSGPPVLSPDGTRLAFSARDDKGKVLLYVRSLTSLTAQPLAGTEDAMYPFWAPDNRQIGFFIPGKVMKVDANGGSPQTVCEASRGRGGTWSREGVIVFNGQVLGPLWRVSASGGVPEAASKLSASENDHRWPQFLPDDKHFLFWGRSGSGPQAHTVYVGLLGSLQAKAILKGTTMATYASGYLLFMRDTKLLAQPFDVRRLEVTGEPVSVAEAVTLNDLSARPVFSASENGTLVYQFSAAPAAWNLMWLTRDGKQTGSITQQGAPFFFPRLSPDGERLAVSFSATLGTNGVWIFDLQRGTRTRLTFEDGIQHSPLWAPDGKTVFYGSNSGGVNHIYAKAADGSGSVRTILANGDASEVPVSFSPDGRYLVYQRRALTGTQTSTDLWVLPLFGDGKPFPVVQTAFDDALGVVAPNGNWMAYQNNESGRNEIYLTRFPGGGAKWQVSTNGGISARWRRDGKELFFVDSVNNMMAVDVDTSGSAVRLGIARTLFTISKDRFRRGAGPYDVTADGKKFLINSGDVKESSEPITLVLNWTAELKK